MVQEENKAKERNVFENYQNKSQLF